MQTVGLKQALSFKEVLYEGFMASVGLKTGHCAAAQSLKASGMKCPRSPGAPASQYVYVMRLLRLSGWLLVLSPSPYQCTVSVNTLHKMVRMVPPLLTVNV